jgi:hypothetical protein
MAPLPPTLRAPAKPWRFASVAIADGTPKWPPYPPAVQGAPGGAVAHLWERSATARSAAGEFGWAFLEEGGEAFLVIVACERDAL